MWFVIAERCFESLWSSYKWFKVQRAKILLLEYDDPKLETEKQNLMSDLKLEAQKTQQEKDAKERITKEISILNDEKWHLFQTELLKKRLVINKFRTKKGKQTKAWFDLPRSVRVHFKSKLRRRNNLAHPKMNIGDENHVDY